MSTTFYGVLGVGPDADEAAVRQAYRDRVTEVHPDVNDDPDANAQFKRITTAKEKLLDASERARYDRLGHASYVRNHVDCSAWSVDADATGGRTDAATHRSGSGASEAGSPGWERGSRSGTETDWNHGTRAGDDSGGASRRRQARATTNGDAGAAGGEQNRAYGDREASGDRTRNQSGDGGRTERSRTESTDTTEHSHGTGASAEPGDTGTASGTGTGTDESTVTGGGSATGTGVGGADGTVGTSGSGDRSRTGTSSGSVSGSYAKSSFWDRVGERPGSKTPEPDPVAVRVFRAMCGLGPWLFVHLAFLGAAVGTCLYVYAYVLSGEASVPLMLVLLGEVGLASVLSTIHIISRLSQ